MGLPWETGRHTVAGVMEPIVNLAEQPGKVVGRRGALSGNHDRLVRNAAALMPRLPYPKGVFRFRTHEEADAWTNEHILRAALQKARYQANQRLFRQFRQCAFLIV